MKRELLQKKQCYVTPEVTVVTFKAEVGFPTSFLNSNSTTTFESTTWGANNGAGTSNFGSADWDADFNNN